MIKNYFKVALRNLLKNRTFSIINIFGLAIGIASVVLITHYVRFEKSYEIMHNNPDNIFRITIDMYNGSEFIVNDAETYQLIGPVLTEQWPEVLDYVRFMHLDVTQGKVEDRMFYEHAIYLADPSVFTVFGYEVLYGEPLKPFESPYKVAMTESTAKKYFGKTDVVGELIDFSITNEPFEVVAVLKDMPQNTHLKFDILMSHASIPAFWPSYEKYPWGGNNEYTYLKVQDGTSVDEFNKKLKAYTESLEQIDDEIFISESISDIHLYSNKTFEPEVNGSAQTVNFLSGVAIFILVLAWVNYINLSTARATERAREVGIRKVVGSNKIQLLRQFMLESFLVNLLASVFAYTLVQLSLPLFKQVTGQNLDTSLFLDSSTWLTFGLIIVAGTILSGIYPALVLSSFTPSTVIKGKFGNSKKGIGLRKGLVILQFLATIVMITMSIGVNNQIQFMSQKKLGFKVDNKLILTYPQLNFNDSIAYQKSETLVARMSELSTVSLVSQSGSLPGADLNDLSTTSYMKRLGDDSEGSFNYYIYGFDEHYLDAMEVKLAAGKNFTSGPNIDQIMINERAVETLGFNSAEEAIGQKVTLKTRNDGEPATIKGVIANYHQRSPKEEYIPMVFPYRKVGNHFILNVETDRPRVLISTLNDIWDEIFPDAAFDYYFLDEQYNQQYLSEERFSNVTLLFTVLSIIIATMGLFGLSSFTILQRTKEIGIRKVLGASIATIIGLLSKGFLKLVLIAGVMAIPLAYWLINLWLENYAHHIDVSWYLFLIPIGVIFFIASLTIVGQVIKSATNNPVDSLRYE